jgi:hypothetical protein
MKPFSTLVLLAPLFLAPFPAGAAPDPVISGPWVELRTAPLFEASVQKLAPVWGPALPVGNDFKVEKVYGRWLYGTPASLPKMKSAQRAKAGWIFSRMLLVPGDEDSLSPDIVQAGRSVLFHGRDAWKKLGLGQAPLYSSLDFFESLTLSKGTLKAFRAQDEAPMAWLPSLPPLLPSLFSASTDARAADGSVVEEKAPSMGLTGTDLGFLDQEFQSKQEKLDQNAKERLSKQLKAPKPSPLNDRIKTALLGRFMLNKYFSMPPLTHEEVDGYIYMRATAMRALDSCPKSVREFWKGRRINLFRVFRLQSRPEIAHPWLEVALPGGYFAYSAKAIELAGNEAELAFLLVRPLVKEMRVRRTKPKFAKKPWPAALNNLSEELWDVELRAQSTKDSENLDVGDEIAVDMAAVECISRAGYRPRAGISYLQKLASHREAPWAAWFVEHSIGLDYRLERVAALTDEVIAQKRIPEGVVTNPKRFATAARFWNLMP